MKTNISKNALFIVLILLVIWNIPLAQDNLNKEKENNLQMNRAIYSQSAGGSTVDMLGEQLVILPPPIIDRIGDTILFLGDFSFNLNDSNSVTGGTEFRDYLYSLGFDLAIITNPPNPITFSYLNNFHAIVFSGLSRTLSTSEVDAFFSYIRSSSGNLLLFGQHGIDNEFPNSSNRNLIGNRFGITFNSDMLCDPGSHQNYNGGCTSSPGDPDNGVEYVRIINFADHFLSNGISSFTLNWGQSLTLTSEAQSLGWGTSSSWGDEDPTFHPRPPDCYDSWYENSDDPGEIHGNLNGLAINESNNYNGKVVAIGDQDMVWNYWFGGGQQQMMRNIFTWFFTPNLRLPENNVNITNTTPYFDWTDIINSISYDIQVDDDSSFNLPEINTTVGVSNYTAASNLVAGTYYWRVRSRNSIGPGDWSEIWSFTIIPSTVTITVRTNPVGRSFTVDGTPYSTTQTFNWTPGTSHSIGTSTPQSGASGTRYAFDTWSDGGGITHDITTPGTSTSYIANFTTQYYLTMNAGSGGSVTPSSGWYNSGVSVQIRATPNSGYSFNQWTGSGSGSYSGTNNPVNITMNSAISEKANFIETLSADFYALITSGFEPLTVEFQDLSTGDIASWSWDFGDDNTSTERNPTHIYESYGSYDVSLRVSSPEGENVMNKQEYIKVVRVNIPDPPTNNTPVTVSVTAPPNFQPIEQVLHYRFGGESEYHSLSLDQDQSTLSCEIPNSLITIRGLEYYIYLFDGTNTITYPQQDPENHPEIMRVTFDDYQAHSALLAEQYEMISIPLELNDTDIMSVFGDDYGEYDWTVWRLFRWSGSKEIYTEYPDLNSELIPGSAFWLITDQGQLFDVDGLSQNTAEPIRFTLTPGWNQIGNPWAFTVAWSDIEKTENVSAPQRWDSQSQQYIPGKTLLQPWTGYFVYNLSSSLVEIVIPPIERSSSELGMETVLAMNEFILKIGLEGLSSGWRDDQNYVGMLQKAKNGLDARDDMEAPPMVERIRLSILEEGCCYAGNFVPPAVNGSYWDMELTTNGSPERGRLWIEDIDKLPAEFSYSLIDQSRQLPIELVDGEARLVVPGQGEVKQLRLLVGTSEYITTQQEELALLPDKFTLHQNYPNPFNPETVIEYQIGERCAVRLDIYTPLGQKIRSLVNREQEAGSHSITWDGRNDMGEQVSSGIYFYWITAGEFHAMRKLILLR